MTSATFTKDPSEHLDYQINWSAWLNGDTILSSSWAASGGGITSGSASFSSTAAIVWVTGGSPDTDGIITNTIETAASRIAERSLLIQLRQL